MFPSIHVFLWCWFKSKLYCMRINWLLVMQCWFFSLVRFPFSLSFQPLGFTRITNLSLAHSAAAVLQRFTSLFFSLPQAGIAQWSLKFYFLPCLRAHTHTLASLFFSLAWGSSVSQNSAYFTYTWQQFVTRAYAYI